MKIYLAVSGEYSDYRACHAFRRREDAEVYPLGDDVEELELREGPVEVRTWNVLYWNRDHPDREADGLSTGNPWMYTHARDYDGNPGNVRHEWMGVGKILMAEGWDLDRVKKVYSEQRAQHKAREAGL